MTEMYLRFHHYCVMISSLVCRYVSKTAASTHLDFDYDGPSMKTPVPGPRSQVIHTNTHTHKGPQTKTQHFYKRVLTFLCLQELLKQLGDIQVSLFLYLSL